MKQYTVAILGATGAVGTQMLECLNEQEFPVGKLKLLASARSAGKTVEFRGEQVVIEEACPEAFEGCDIVLGAAGDDIAKELLPEAVKRGAVVVDNSHAFRMDPEVPLVVHPNMPAGTIFFFTERLPYPLSNVGNTVQMLMRQDYYQIEWPLRTRKYEYGVYADEVLQNYFPPAFGVLTNIAAG